MARASKRSQRDPGSRAKSSLNFTIASVLVVALVIIILGGVFYFSRQLPQKSVSSVPPEGPANEPAPVSGSTEPEGAAGAGEALKPGDVGEVIEENQESGTLEPLVSPTIPSSIFSTTGKIIKINGEKLILAGSGTNFADGQARELTCSFSDNTLTVTKNPLKYYKGTDGLNRLQEGVYVLVMSGENIRGKTEFSLKAVKVLETGGSP